MKRTQERKLVESKEGRRGEGRGRGIEGEEEGARSREPLEDAE
jgi:hypothetical protein